MKTWREILLLLWASTVLRLLAAAWIPLFPDETYYWEWSRRLAGGYFDHPPMIALLIRVGTGLLGDTPLGVRFVPILSGTAAGAALVMATHRLVGEGGARLAAWLFLCLPLATLGYVLATPDAPLLCFVAATLYCLVRVFQAAPGSAESTRWWSWAGVCIGLAMLSKYTGVLVPAGLALAVAVYPPTRRRLAEPGPYLAVLLASVLMLPVLRWNAQHDWASFAFQLGHGLGSPAKPGLGALLQRELNLVGGQLGLVSPVLFVLLAAAGWRALVRPLRHVDVAFAGTSLFVFAFFVYSATRKNVEANWPALAYLPATILLCAQVARGDDRQRRWMRIGLGIGGTLGAVALVAAMSLLLVRLGLRPGRDPVARAHGWELVADSTMALADRVSGTGTWFAANRYQDASQLAFFLERRAPRARPVFALNVRSRTNQYDLWPRFADEASPGDALVVLLDTGPGGQAVADSLRPHFTLAVAGDSVPLLAAGKPLAWRKPWAFVDWKGSWITSARTDR